MDCLQATAIKERQKDAILCVWREWMRGCSCAPPGAPWQCEECTKAAHDRIKALAEGSD